MELEGVLGLVFMFHELVRPMRMFIARSGDSWDNQIKKEQFFPYLCKKSNDLFAIALIK